MAKKLTSVRWRLHMAAVEFGVDDKTLEKAIKVAGLVPGEDGCFSTRDICVAIFGDLKGDLIRAQTRDANESADIKAIKKANLLRENIPAALVEKVWSAAISELRQRVLYSALADDAKADILHDLKAIPVEEYFATAAADKDEGGDE